MIPEIQRSLPPRLFSYGLWTYSFMNTPRCVKKYGKPNNDAVVLDIGAFHGEYSIPISKTAHKVYAIEPDYTNFQYLRQATKNIGNIFCLNCAIWTKNGVHKFNMADNGSESVLSTLSPDISEYTTEYVPILRLDSLPFIHEIDFIKLDGEGHEPEILQSLGEYRPNQIMVDVSPERNGESTKRSVIDILQSYGYRCEINGDILSGYYER